MSSPSLPERDDSHDLSQLDAEGTLALAEQMLRRRREAELEDLRIAAHWAALHSTDPRRTVDGRRAWAYDRLIEVGGEGSPRVREFCIAELAMARQVHPLSGQSLIADTLDLQHRLPLTWQRVVALEAESWLARKVASLTRGVPLALVGLVDRAVAAIIATESPTRVLTVTQAKIIEADPAAHAAKVEAARRRRYVALSRVDEHGLRHVIARVTAGDATWVDALLDRIADRIARDHPDGTSRDELRSIAFGWLARPEDLLALLQGRRDESAEPRKQGRNAVVYVHLHEAALLGLTPGAGFAYPRAPGCTAKGAPGRTAEGASRAYRPAARPSRRGPDQTTAYRSAHHRSAGGPVRAGGWLPARRAGSQSLR